MLLFSKGGDSIGMGWHTLAHESSELTSKRPCKCGKGFIYSYFVTTEESEYPPFERGYEKETTDCPNNCEQIKRS